ncbi:hypothetical protein BDP27DRAFT_1275425 [Rhodocollybia butyracea]|uniref:Tyr recombinase domain-containing protein n=1 Tax=Rhodocollybia butyracea TaxID=206335 RepID=A0A9P5P738_9AGAR|nr:hypothetical protein BDP27DRAFT_1275425 [Rhodocollybia butyracea]
MMMRALHLSLDLTNSFDACVWAACCCAFWGLMRFGESGIVHFLTTVRSRSAFSPANHLTRSNAHALTDSLGKPYIRLDLPCAKTADPGKRQSVYISTGGDTCSKVDLDNLAQVCPTSPSSPLFSWRDGKGDVRPLTRDAALTRINSILRSLGWGNSFGHSFRIGGASYLLGQGVAPEVVRIAGRLRSLAYELYVHSFENVMSHHLSGVAR